MYTREIQNPRETPIENGKPVAGTWNKAFTQVNLLDIRRPYRFPLPRWLIDLRLKEWEGFSAQDEHFFLDAFLGNLKFFQIAQVVLYNKGTGQNYVFRKLVFGKNWKLPRNLGNASVECRTPHFFFRIHTWLTTDTIKLDLDITASKKLPPLTAHLAYSIGSRDAVPAAVSLNFSERRSMYAYKALTSIRGDIVLGEKHFTLNPANCTGIFRDYKGFFPHLMRWLSCSSMGFDEDGKRFGFHIAENQAKENRKNNENALWLNKRFTPLPPVRITMHDGRESDWIIQDLDGMVDLVFTPKEISRIGRNLVVAGGDFFAAMGYYNGVLVNARDEKIQVRNQWGVGEILYLRV